MAILTELTDLLVYGVDFKNRRIYFGHLESDPESSTEFTQTSVEFAIRALHRMVTENPNKPVEFHVNSFGGGVYDALRLHDEILACSAQIKFYGGGAIMSAATLVMVACDERYLYVNTRIMIHELSDLVEEARRSDIKINTQENDTLHKIMCDIYAANSRMGADFWSDIMSKDVYMSASEAVSIGLCDSIVEPKKRGNLRKKRQANLKKEIDIKSLVKELYERTGRTKIPKLELNPIVKEPIDPSIVIDNTPMPEIEKPVENLPASDKSDEA